VSVRVISGRWFACNMDVFWHVLEAVWNILLQCFKVAGAAVWAVVRSTEFISALGGAFFGVAGASLLESRRKRHEKRDREYEAFLRTQAVIICQGNSLGWIAKDYPPAKSFDNLSTIVLGFTRQMVDFKDLAFIAKSSDPQLLIELDVANERYDFFRRVLDSRNATIEEILRHPAKDLIIRDFLRPREAEDTPADANVEEVVQMMAEGPKLLLLRIRAMNRAVSERLAKAKDANEKTKDRLLSFGQKEFPGLQVLHAREDASSTRTSDE
jgi:hypothetical protein